MTTGERLCSVHRTSQRVGLDDAGIRRGARLVDELVVQVRELGQALFERLLIPRVQQEVLGNLDALVHDALVVGQ